MYGKINYMHVEHRQGEFPFHAHFNDNKPVFNVVS